MKLNRVAGDQNDQDLQPELILIYDYEKKKNLTLPFGDYRLDRPYSRFGEEKCPNQGCANE
jgi:hypothetical protein